MSKTSCEIWPKVEGTDKESRLYKDILKKVGDRPRANWLYASYLASNVAQKMEAQGITSVDSRGQHYAKDYLHFINWKKMQQEISNFSQEEINAGSKDNTGNLINYTDAEDALLKAKTFNDNHDALVASVIQRGDIYNIIVYEKNSRTHTYGNSIETRLKTWDVYKQVFRAAGVDLTALPSTLKQTISPFNYRLIDELERLQRANVDHLYGSDVLKLFYLNSNIFI